MRTSEPASLRLQLRTELEPVLRPADLAAFDLDRAFRIVADIAAKSATGRE